MTYEDWKAMWEKKSTARLQKEIRSWEKYMQKHSSAYAWHGKDITPPGCLSDGDKLTALKEIVRERLEKGSGAISVQQSFAGSGQEFYPSPKLPEEPATQNENASGGAA